MDLQNCGPIRDLAMQDYGSFKFISGDFLPSLQRLDAQVYDIVDSQQHCKSDIGDKEIIQLLVDVV